MILSDDLVSDDAFRMMRCEKRGLPHTILCVTTRKLQVNTIGWTALDSLGYCTVRMCATQQQNSVRKLVERVSIRLVTYES